MYFDCVKCSESKTVNWFTPTVGHKFGLKDVDCGTKKRGECHEGKCLGLVDAGTCHVYSNTVHKNQLVILVIRVLLSFAIQTPRK